MFLQSAIIGTLYGVGIVSDNGYKTTLVILCRSLQLTFVSTIKTKMLVAHEWLKAYYASAKNVLSVLSGESIKYEFVYLLLTKA